MLTGALVGSTLCRGVPAPLPLVIHRNFNVVSSEKLFDKVLVANRGEIACRVMKTCKRLGIKTVALYSEADTQSKHVRMADEAVCVGPPPSALSYLNQDAIMEAIRRTGAQAVHPGYGFLSENESFAKRLEQAGVVFIGPPSSAIHVMGDKIESKRLAHGAGVNTIPGFIGEVHTNEEVLKVCNEIGYPVMVKAAHGGGGKGMRIAWNDKEALEGFALSKSEAKNAFGNDAMLIEKFIADPRHIEIQVLGDKHGNTLWINERECSIQRRNQKVLEEAPSPHLDAKTRKAMGEQAVALAKAVGYYSAGTVECLSDKDRNFYFLEMNTRLQVEHPITEMITGLDLVEQMLRVAAGHPLKIKQSDIGIKGWAMEARVYAEDPLRGFLPSIGRLTSYAEPVTTLPDTTVRCDSGVNEGSEISMYYDPLISKLVTHGPDRASAIAAMRHALDSYVIRGVRHNVCFLRDTLDHPLYVAGKISTNFIPTQYPKGFSGHVLTADEERQVVATAAIVRLMHLHRDTTLDATASNPLSAPLSSYEQYFGAHSHTPFVVTLSGKNHYVALEVVDAQQDGADDLDGDVSFETVNVHFFDAADLSKPSLTLCVGSNWQHGDPVFAGSVLPPIDDDAHDSSAGAVPAAPQPVQEWTSQVISVGAGARSQTVQHVGTMYPVVVSTPDEFNLQKYMIAKKAADLGTALVSPMPGRVVSVACKPGDKVTAGDALVIVEAMKMQNVLRAKHDGVVKAVPAKINQTVALDQVLVTFEDK